jgi:hypothetical protein
LEASIKDVIDKCLALLNSGVNEDGKQIDHAVLAPFDEVLAI